MAPATEQSATSMRLSLGSNLKFEERKDIADNLSKPDGPPLRMFSLDGTPCDCVIVAIDGGLEHWVPEMKLSICVSGINQGPNSLLMNAFQGGSPTRVRFVRTSIDCNQFINISALLICGLWLQRGMEAAVAVLPHVAENTPFARFISRDHGRRY